jgi:hypothetical protein
MQKDMYQPLQYHKSSFSALKFLCALLICPSPITVFSCFLVCLLSPSSYPFCYLIIPKRRMYFLLLELRVQVCEMHNHYCSLEVLELSLLLFYHSLYFPPSYKSPQQTRHFHTCPNFNAFLLLYIWPCG